MNAILEGGPFAAQSVETPAGSSGGRIGLPIDDDGKPAQNAHVGIAVYQLAGTAEDPRYVFSGCQRIDGQPFSMEFIDGPAKGVRPSPIPARWLPNEIQVPLLGDDTPFAGQGDPVSVAVYGKCELDGRMKLACQRIDRAASVVASVKEHLDEQRLANALQYFYVNPNYDLYTMKPTGEHVQVPVQVGFRRGHVDEGIAPLISEIWRLDFDTFGSCQRRPAGHNFAAYAYVAFPRRRDAKDFRDLLSALQIRTILVENTIKIGRRDPAGAGEPIEFPSGNVMFEADAIGAITEAMNRFPSLSELRGWLSTVPPSLRHEHIAFAAYLIWEKEGRPHGRDVAHWLMAVDELRRSDTQ